MNESRKGCGSEVTVAMIGCMGSIVAAIIGGVFTLISVWGGPPPISNTTQPVLPATPNTIVEIPTPLPVVEEQPTVALPATTGCPQADGGFWLQYPDTWYGPYGNGDLLAFHSSGGFSVWDVDWINLDGTVGATIPYPDPWLQFPRDQWVPLQQSIFTVCIDSSGNVFGWAG